MAKQNQTCHANTKVTKKQYNNKKDDDDDDNNNNTIIVHNKETNTWTLLEGTVCQVDKIADRVKEKQTKYLELCAGIKRDYYMALSHEDWELQNLRI